MGRRRYSWEPPEDMQTHAGDDVSRNDDFFAGPPEEIGELSSVSTTLRYDKEPVSPTARLLWAMSGVFLGGLVGLFIGAVTQSLLSWGLVLPVVLGGAGGGIAWLVTRFSHTCTFVGKEGVARITCSGSRDELSEEVFRFRDATELRIGQTRRYTNGVYQGTDYSYAWTDVGGRQCYSIKGTHNSEQGRPAGKDAYHFAVASELAWSQYMLEEADRQLMTKGEVRFRLSGGDWVAIGKGYLRLRLGGQTIERDRRDVAAITVEQGVFKVREVGGKEGWFSSRGVFKFQYNDLANAQLFLFLLDKVAGLTID